MPMVMLMAGMGGTRCIAHAAARPLLCQRAAPTTTTGFWVISCRWRVTEPSLMIIICAQEVSVS